MAKKTQDNTGKPNKTEQPADGDPALDVMPLPDDDGEAATGAAPAAAPPERREEDDDGDATPKRAPDPERDDIVARFRAKRDAERAAAGEDAGEGERTPAAETTESTGEGDDATAGKQPDASAQEPEITLIVDGKPIRKKQREVIALAQMAVAGDNRLDETKRLLKEAQALRAGQSEHPPKDGDEPGSQADQTTARATPEHKPVSGVSREELARIAERIQVGNQEEGAEALADLVERVNAGRAQSEQVNQEQVGRLVQQHVFHNQTSQEINGAIKKFGTDYPEIAKDKDFVRVGFERVAVELTADLKKAGLSDEDLASFNGDPRALASAHRQAKMNGVEVRSYADILDTVGDGLVKKFNLRPEGQRRSGQQQQQQPRNAQQPTASDRLALKRNAPQQPRTAGARTPAPQPPRPKTAREKVEDMRAQRGFGRTS